ncbi:MAG: GGDEF domain-containing protein [Acetobacter sp.]|jgi:diguanylate cyclase (GGDEF)-like protein|nr:GGDEF domain-containing protein [Acetobacter sp.]
MLSVVMNNQKNLIARLNKMAMHDSLTNTLTRRAYIERTEALINGALPDNFQGMSVLMVDLDKFKDINDRYGHLAGDMALVVVSETLMKHLPHNALIGRLGGEEFAVTLFNLSLDATIQLSDMLCRKVSELEIKPKDGIKLQVTISIGVSHQHHVGHDSLQSLLHDADSALYEAKKQGRNRSLHIAEFPSQQGNDHSGTLYQGGSCLP